MDNDGYHKVFTYDSINHLEKIEFYADGVLNQIIRMTYSDEGRIDLVHSVFVMDGVEYSEAYYRFTYDEGLPVRSDHWHFRKMNSILRTMTSLTMTARAD